MSRDRIRPNLVSFTHKLESYQCLQPIISRFIVVMRYSATGTTGTGTSRATTATRTSARATYTDILLLVER